MRCPTLITSSGSTSGVSESHLFACAHLYISVKQVSIEIKKIKTTYSQTIYFSARLWFVSCEDDPGLIIARSISFFFGLQTRAAVFYAFRLSIISSYHSSEK